MADKIGCKRSYVSALENDIKRAPPEAFVQAICDALQLPELETEALHEARRKSRRQYAIPPDATGEIYEFVDELFAKLERLSELQLHGMRAWLAVGDGESRPQGALESRIRRKDRRQPDTEDAM